MIKSKNGLQKSIKIICLLIIGAILWWGFGPVRLKADISQYGEQKIKITGVLENEFYITPNELAQMKLTYVTATGRSAKAGHVKAVGPTMQTFLKQYGRKVSDFKQVKVYASDDYSTVLVDSLREKEIVLAIAAGSEPLEEYQWPLRLVIPKDDPSRWIRLIEEMEFTLKE